MVKYDRRALTEVYEVLLMLRKEQYDKIPENIVTAIKENRDREYEVDINEIEENMLLETREILSSIYMYYLATSYEKKMLSKMAELEKNENYSAQVIFDKNKSTARKELLPIPVNENIWNKIKKQIKKIFKR